jgi:hypothetical protein
MDSATRRHSSLSRPSSTTIVMNLVRTFAVAHDRLRELGGHREHRVANDRESGIALFGDRRDGGLSGRGDHEAVVGRRVAVDRRAS